MAELPDPPSPALRHGERRRREILAAAIDVSSAEGLAGLSIGRLALETGMSKSGLFAHFGSKQALQLATVAFAAEGFERAVVAPAEEAEPGLPRLRVMLLRWSDYIESSVNRGGCFFDATSSEFSSRPGPVRDRLARLCASWLRKLEREARTALRLGELRRSADPELLAFRLHAYVEEANWTRELLGDATSFAKARRAIAETLREATRPLKPEKGKRR